MTPERAQEIAAELGLDVESVGAVHIENARAVANALRQRNGGAADDLAERNALIEALVVNESWFFRDGAPFRVLAERLAQRPGRVRILSAPSARGEEAWSVAMALANAGRSPASFEVVGLDVSNAAVEAARRAVYQPLAFRGEYAAQANVWLENTAAGSRVIDVLRPAVRFEVANLISPLPWPSVVGDFDAILCRNLLIYLTAEARAQVMRSLRRLLAPDGILVASHAEGHAFVQAGMQRVEGGAGMVFEEASSTQPVARSSEPPQTLPNVRWARASSTPGAPPEAPAPVAARPPGEQQSPPPVVAESELTRARWLADAGLYDDAASAIATHLNILPDDVDAWELLGVVCLARNRHADAAAAYQHALELAPSRPDLLEMLARIADLRGRAELASTYRMRAVAIRTGAP